VSLRALITAALGTVAIVAAVILIGGDSPYRMAVQLSTANGLRDGSQVKIGGVGVGKIESLELGPGDAVIAKLALDHSVRVGRGAAARVVTSNLLGSKFIELRPGDTRTPQPSGSVIPANRVSYPVDLDQVVNVLDGDTRARLQILIDEAGAGLTGRRADWSQTLRVLAPTLADADRVVATLTQDNNSLAHALATGSRFVSRLSGERRQLSRLVQVAGTAMRTTADRRRALARTLQDAPGTLTEARAFLADLQATAVPLGPAARALRDSAPALTATLAELPAFQRAADPTLRQASTTAPALTQLAQRATPVLREAVPTLSTVAQFSRTLAPVSKTLRVSIDDTLGLVEGWGRAIQTRDRLGHVFRGRAAVGVETFRSAIAKLAELLHPRQAKRHATPERSLPTPAKTPNAPAIKPKLPDLPKLPKLPRLHDLTQQLPSQLTKTAESVLGDLLGRSPARGSAPRGDEMKRVLHFLLAP
jgi:phospholipid/cholesterol/gamma-HCH transport system substrate-binding protein